MKKLIAAAAVSTLMFGGVAGAETQIMASVPAQSTTVTDWYKQSVYDPSKRKSGEVMDVLLSPDGRMNARRRRVSRRGREGRGGNFLCRQADDQRRQGPSYTGYVQGHAEGRTGPEV